VSLNLIKKLKILKKLDFYTSKKSISRNGYVIKGKTEFANEFQKKFNPNGGNFAKRNSKSMQFFFPENC
jgi:hypothetical protein